MGSQEKEHTNSNGEYLLDTPRENNIITNTDFPFKLTHRATSTSLDEDTSNHSLKLFLIKISLKIVLSGSAEFKP